MSSERAKQLLGKMPQVQCVMLDYLIEQGGEATIYSNSRMATYRGESRTLAVMKRTVDTALERGTIERTGEDRYRITDAGRDSAARRYYPGFVEPRRRVSTHDLRAID